jgi:CheY-like chemotaxis protein
MSRIFFIDNVIYLTRLYERAFRLAGHEIETARDPVLALKRLESVELLPELIIMDVHMPNMTGEDLCRRLRTDTHTKDIPVLVMTNSIKQEEMQKFIEISATSSCLMKMDYNPAEIVKKAEEIINATK